METSDRRLRMERARGPSEPVPEARVEATGQVEEDVEVAVKVPTEIYRFLGAVADLAGQKLDLAAVLWKGLLGELEVTVDALGDLGDHKEIIRRHKLEPYLNWNLDC